MNVAAAADVVLERLRRVAATHWRDITLDPLIELWSLAPAIVSRLSALPANPLSEVSMPFDVDIKQWIADADVHASFLRTSCEAWRQIARRWHTAAETSTVDKEAKQRASAAAALVADDRLRCAAIAEQTARQLRALLTEPGSASTL